VVAEFARIRGLPVPNSGEFGYKKVVKQSLRTLRVRGERFVLASQNAAEFWNVCTRPAQARGGFGLSVAETDKRLRLAERLFRVLADLPAAYARWRQLLVLHSVMGVQVHDARLVAWMESHGISQILTLNPADFSRYPGITPITPQEVLATASP
jgi:predicted nucleic acid-binding protein